MMSPVYESGGFVQVFKRGQGTNCHFGQHPKGNQIHEVVSRLLRLGQFSGEGHGSEF